MISLAHSPFWSICRNPSDSSGTWLALIVFFVFFSFSFLGGSGGSQPCHLVWLFGSMMKYVVTFCADIQDVSIPYWIHYFFHLGCYHRHWHLSRCICWDKYRQQIIMALFSVFFLCAFFLIWTKRPYMYLHTSRLQFCEYSLILVLKHRSFPLFWYGTPTWLLSDHTMHRYSKLKWEHS